MSCLVSLTLIDGYNRTTHKRYGCNANTVADAQTYADALLADLEDVSDLGQAKVEVTFPLTVTVPVAAVAGANIDVGGTLHAELTSGKGYGLKVPGIKDSMVNADGSIAIDDAAIVAFVANFEAGDHFTVSDGETIATVKSGELDK